MTNTISEDAAYGVVRSVGNDNVVVKLQPAQDGAKDRVLEPLSIFHEGTVARAQLTEPCDATDTAMAELRAALLVIAREDQSNGPNFVLNEKDIAYLRLICEGFNDAECADRLGISVRAIKSRKKSVLSATSSTSLSHAIKRFLREYK